MNSLKRMARQLAAIGLCLWWITLAQVVAAESVLTGGAGAGPALGEAVDIAPWGERMSWEKGRDTGIYWEDPRDVHRVVVAFAGSAPTPGAARLQWWQSQWPANRIPRDTVSGAGGSGWLNIGDWYQGTWRDADAVLSAAGNTWSFTFQPVNQKEYPAMRDFSAPYRTTLKLRLLFYNTAPPVSTFQVFSDSRWQAVDVAVEWGGTAGKARQTWDGHLEVFNGYAGLPAALNAQTRIGRSPDGAWKSTVQGQTSGIRTRIWYADSSNVNSFDQSVVTVRARQHSFSFDPRAVARGAKVFAPIYGVLVHRADEAETYAGARARWQSRTDKPIYERVFGVPEQTFARAWSEMPPKRQFYFPVGCEGGRQRFGVDPDGSVFCVNDRIDEPPGKDTPKRVWGGNRLRYAFGLPNQTPSRRWIEDNCLPIIHAQWERDGIRYTQTAFATRLDPGGLGWPDMHADDTTVLMVKIVAENTRSQPASVSAGVALEVDGRPVELAVRNGLVYAQLPSSPALRCGVDVPEGAELSLTGGKASFSGELPGNEQTEMILRIPFVTLDQPGEIERLRQLDFSREFDRVKAFWKARADASCQITTPVPEINNFYRAVVSHLMINCGREVNADRLMARVGGFGYGVYGNESCMMITDLDRRGFHAEAERCLEAFLHYQGTVPLPGDYVSQKGVFNGAGGWESGGYNQHHGWILWAMAEHYWQTKDAAWLRKNADRLIEACRWIMRERARTQGFKPGALRAIERGLLPPGSLEDIGDWRCWLSNNVFSWWGLDAIARAFKDLDHPAAKELLAEAGAYRRDMLEAFREAMVRSPLQSLRDGTYIPQIPSEAHRRGRSFGWITATLEGPIYLIRTGAIDPSDPLALAIMQDYEDNLYLSEQYGYSPSHLDHWFSQGGFSMQPNLLCSPHPYLMRDEIKHFLRSYFNAFAVAYYPNTQMLTEHPLPEMGDWRGDHYKSSDEANSSYWLRLMFVDERGDDLYLGMAVPRNWLADGCRPAIERAGTRYGPLSLRFESHAGQGSIQAVFEPPRRTMPRTTYVRIRHPEGKPIRSVRLDGKPWRKFDRQREWIELPPLDRTVTITANY